MIKDEIIKLEKQIDELENNYELSKQQREKLVSEMEELDSRIEELNKQLDLASPTNALKENSNRKQKNKELLQKSLNKLGTINLIILIANWLVFKFSASMFQIIIVLISMYSYAVIPEILIYLKNKEKIPSNKKLSKKAIKLLEEEYNSVVDLRIVKGQQYKQVREAEVTACNVYKVLKELLKEKINYIITLGTSSEDNRNTFFMNDIYYKISVGLMNHFNADEDVETKITLFDNELKKYLIEKITDNSFGMSEPEKLKKLTTEELIQVMANYIPISNHHTTLNHVIHAILAFAGNMQSYTIVWSEETDETLIHNPSIIFDSQGRWNELKTHKNTDYITIFNMVYSNLFNNFMIEEKVKRRTKQK